MQEEDEKSVFYLLLFEVVESKSKINENKISIFQENEKRVKTMNKIDGGDAKSREHMEGGRREKSTWLQKSD